jgi:hypothetical protein
MGQLCALGVAEGWVTPGRSTGVQVGHGAGEPGRSGSGLRTARFPDIVITAERPGGPGQPATGARGGRPTVMTPTRVEAARELLPVHRVTEIARKLGVSRSTLYAHMDTILGADRP